MEYLIIHLYLRCVQRRR